MLTWAGSQMLDIPGLSLARICSSCHACPAPSHPGAVIGSGTLDFVTGLAGSGGGSSGGGNGRSGGGACVEVGGVGGEGGGGGIEARSTTSSTFSKRQPHASMYWGGKGCFQLTH